MNRKIFLLALLLTLILVYSCAKNNPVAVNDTGINDTTDKNDGSILLASNDGSIPPESNGLEGISLDTTKISGIYSSEYTYFTLTEDLYKSKLHRSMNVEINEAETSSGIEVKLDFAWRRMRFVFTNFNVSIKDGDYYLESDVQTISVRDTSIVMVFDCKDYSLKRVTLTEKNRTRDENMKKTAITFIKGIRRDKY